MKNHNSRTSLRRVVPIAVAAVAAVTLVGFPRFVSGAAPDAAVNARVYLSDLRSQVDTPAAAPRPGGDPARQRQQSLAAAAAQPNGIGRRVAKPARAVRGDRSRRVAPERIYAALEARGLNQAGCFIDYGRPGDQCLPAHVAQGQTVTCTAVRAHFPDGIVVTRRDRFRLDRNGDGVACGRGD
jgi:hypothetical protein